jgi:CubicO group peptidase (beta-lactamase class C family)
MATPGAVAPFYGRLLWLNPGGRAFRGASPEALFMIGAGGHWTWIDPTFDAVVVMRWLDAAHAPEAIARFGAALGG